MRKLFTIAIIAIILIGGFYAFNSYIYNEKQKGPPVSQYRGTLAGEYTCLPLADTNVPQTLDCAFGMKTESGEYYAVDFKLMSQEKPDLKPGDRFTASGLITPVSLIKETNLKKYTIEGIFDITDSVNKL